MLPWEKNHPLNGNPCPVTGRMVYIENSWKVTRSDYRLKTGILESGVVLSLPVGYTRIGDTESFFKIMHQILKCSLLNAEQFILIEDYTFHTGSDYEGRITYIKRMIDEIHPLGIVFITRSANWRLSIKIGRALYLCPFPIKCVSSYREAFSTGAELLKRPIAGSGKKRTPDTIDNIHFAVTLDIKSTSLVLVKYNGCPQSEDLSSIADLYLSLSVNPKLCREFRTVHDLSSMTLPKAAVLYRLLQMVLSRPYNSGVERYIITGESRILMVMIYLGSFPIRDWIKIRLFESSDDAYKKIGPGSGLSKEQSGVLQMAAIGMLETVAWDKTGVYELERVNDPDLKPLALMLGAIKQDIDYYIEQRQKELKRLEDAHNRSRKISTEIDLALQASERDRINSETLSNENLSLSMEIAKAQKEVFLVLSDYIDKRALVAAGSTRKLARFVVNLAELFEYTKEEGFRLHDATLLYHVGYLAVGEDEHNCELHCRAGSEVLSNIYTFIMQYAAHIAHYHHEKWNGTGYPDHLIGDQIPQEAQLIAVAEFILSCETEQIEYRLIRESGISFDPEMVKVILMNREKIISFLELLPT
jgi:response regulator RpfG family c-di-GMP phosphodiesterase